MNANSCEHVCLHLSSNNVPEYCTQYSHTCLNANHCKLQTLTCLRDVKCSFDVVLMVLFHTESDRTHWVPELDLCTSKRSCFRCIYVRTLTGETLGDFSSFCH